MFMLMPWESECFENGIYFRLSNQSSRAKRVVLVHGLGGNMNAWDMVARFLFHSGIGYMRLDLPGHGLSRPVSHRNELLPERIAEKLKGLLEELGMSRPFMVVHSFANLLLPFMDFRKAVMVSPPYMKAKNLARISWVAELFEGLGYLSLRWERPSTHEYDFSRKHKDFELYGFFKDVFPWHLSTMLFGLSMDIPDFRRLSSRKVLIVHGIHDSLVPITHARILAKLIHARLVELDDNHIIPINSWESLSSIAIRFFGG